MAEPVENASASEIAAFFEAIDKGDLAAVKKTVEENPGAVNWEKDEIGPLLAAITSSDMDHRKEIAFFLIDHGTNLNARQPIPDGEPMIPFSLHWSGEDIALKLVEKGADLTWKSPPGGEEKIKEICAVFENTFIPGTGITFLMSAASSNALRLAAALLDKGADINEKDSRGQTALMYAADNGHTAMTDLLISRGASLAGCGEDGQDLLTIAQNGLNQQALPSITEAFRQIKEEIVPAMHAGTENPISVSGPLKLKRNTP